MKTAEEPPLSLKLFVAHESIVRRIWGDGDIMLFILAGSAAEFAVNRAVDWLFFTGKLPGDPMGRLFSTVRFVKEIIFVEEAVAIETMNRIGRIHQAVEDKRGAQIPDWAHRDVLYMLLDYSERAHELLRRPLMVDEKTELYDVFWRVGQGLRIPDLPDTYEAWRRVRVRDLPQDLARSHHTAELYAAYRRQLGTWRWHILRQIQAQLVPEPVGRLLNLTPRPLFRHLLRAYRPLVRIGLRPLIRLILVPRKYVVQVSQMDTPI